MLTGQWTGHLWEYSLIPCMGRVIYFLFKASIPALGSAQASIFMATGGAGA